MNDRKKVHTTSHAQAPDHHRDLDVPRCYVRSLDDSATVDMYWVLDSTRGDLEVAGPLDFASAIRASVRFNAEADELEREMSESDRPLPSRIYQLTGAKDDRCLLKTAPTVKSRGYEKHPSGASHLLDVQPWGLNSIWTRRFDIRPHIERNH